MPGLTRRTVLVAMGLLTTAGCTTGPRTDSSTGDPPTDRSPTGTSPPTDGSPTGNWITRGENEPDADHAVYLSNRGTRERTIRIRVVRRATGDTVFDATRTVSPGTEREVYNLKQAEPDGIEEFSICGRFADPTPTPPGTPTPTPTDTSGTPDSPFRECITMRTDGCYGTAHVTVQESGELGIVYSIC